MSSKRQNPEKSAPGMSDPGFDAKMALAETIMRKDADILHALAGDQLAAAREVMARRKRALRKLAR